jgi:hypothetical protein
MLLEVATATFLEARTRRKLDPVEKALLCQRAEHEFAGVPCGIMDQFTSALAQGEHLLLLDCRSRAVELVRMADPEVAVLIVNTNVRHELASGEYARRRAQCEVAAKVLGVPSLRDATMTCSARAIGRGLGLKRPCPFHARPTALASCAAHIDGTSIGYQRFVRAKPTMVQGTPLPRSAT